MPAFRVDTDQMVSAVGNIKSGAGFLKGDAKSRLESIYSRIGAAAFDHNGDAQDKVGGFRDRWNDEFGIVGDMLSKFEEALTKASDTYNGSDHEIATALQPQPGTPPAEV